MWPLAIMTTMPIVIMQLSILLRNQPGCVCKSSSFLEDVELTFWDYNVNYISTPDEFPTVDEKEPDEYAEINQGYEFPEKLFQRVECGVMAVGEPINSVYVPPNLAMCTGIAFLSTLTFASKLLICPGN